MATLILTLEVDYDGPVDDEDIEVIVDRMYSQARTLEAEVLGFDYVWPVDFRVTAEVKE